MDAAAGPADGRTMTRHRAWRPAPWLQLTGAALAAAAAVAVALALLSPEMYSARAIDDIATVVAAALSTAGCLIAARRQSYARRSWQWLAVGAAFLTVAEGIWGWYELVWQRDVPSPGPADVGYLAGSAVQAIAVFLLPLARRRSVSLSWVRRWLDGFIVVGSVLAISWALVLHEAFDQGHSGFGELAVTVAYPLCDVLTIAAVALTLPLTPRRYRTPLMLVAGGVLAAAVGDSVYTYLTLKGTY